MTSSLEGTTRDSTRLETKRTKCPFYGFYATNGAFIDSRGNQCGIILSANSPCQMEMDGRNPSWTGCRYNDEKFARFVKNNEDDVRVFPREFGTKSVSLKDWMDYLKSPLS